MNLQVARLEGRCVETPNEDPTENEQVEMHDASLGNKQGPSDSNHVENSGENSAYLMALLHQRIYLTLPDDISHATDVGDTSVKQKKSTIAVQHAHVGENGANLQGHSSSSPGSTSAFMTAAISVSDHDDDAGLETALQNQNPDASNGLTRKSLMHAKQFQGSQQILSPTVPVNYAIQQLSEGKKDPAIIRKELAEMYSERVDEVSVHDKVASSRSEGRKQQLGPVPSSVAKKPCTGVQQPPGLIHDSGVGHPLSSKVRAQYSGRTPQSIAPQKKQSDTFLAIKVHVQVIDKPWLVECT